VTRIADLLSPGERLLVATRRHPASLAPRIARSLALAAACVALAIPARGLDGPLRIAAYAVLLLVASAAAVRAAQAVRRWERSVLAITTRQILVLDAAGRRRSVSLPLGSVQRLSIAQTMSGRMLGYGTVELVESGARRGLRFVPRPAEVSRAIAGARR
jgi:hypothetical protein